MAFPELNFDVLLHLMETQAFQGQSFVVPIMQTCRTLQNRGASLLLRNGAVVRGPRAITSFYSFMLADTRRYHALERLTLDLDGFLPDSQVCQKLSLLFQQAVFLAELSVHDSEFLASRVEVSDAIAGLTRLKKLLLFNGNPPEPDCLYAMFAKFKSPIRELAINFYHSNDPVDIPNPFMVLQALSPHLERLLLTYASFESADNVVFPRMKYLTCEPPVAMVAFDVLNRAFPNIEALHVGDCLAVRSGFREPYRSLNIQAQQTRRWQRLACLGGLLLPLYVLALQCPVTTLDLYLPKSSLYDLDMLSAVLCDSPPTNLRISLNLTFDFSVLQNAIRVSVQSLRRLAIEVPVSRGSDLQDLFDTVLSVLGVSRLEYFRLTLNIFPLEWVVVEYDSEGNPGLVVTDPCKDPTPEVSWQLDPPTCARRIMDRVDTMRTILLDWRHELCLFAASIQDEDGTRSLITLGKDAARNLRHEVEGGWYAGLPEGEPDMRW